MKTLTNANARDVQDAVKLSTGKSAAFAGGGSDLLGMVKDRIVSPDVIVNLKTIRGLDQISASGGALKIGGLTTLDSISRNETIRRQYAVLAEAAESVGTPQIRNVGTIAGNVCQRPWCWYYRNGFKCYKAGGNTCFSAAGENRLHAIFGGGPSFIVHPSDTAPALVALNAKFHVSGPAGERTVPASEFFVLPRQDAARENVLANNEVLTAIEIRAPARGVRSTYHKILDREAWTHAVVSAAVVLDMDKDICRSARIVLGGVAPIPWNVPEAEHLLAGQRITPELAVKAGDAAVAGAKPLAKNGYKVPLTRNTVARTILALGNRTA